MEFFPFPNSCMKMLWDSEVALIEAWEEVFFAFLFSLLSLRLFHKVHWLCIGILYYLEKKIKSVLFDNFLCSLSDKRILIMSLSF